ncbi:MAG TPA: hypothetical protein DCQ32_05825, partial [Cyanobacteria bacterium UBA8156]|nr:hypothetical protein [Cyanobacteria bacterium UBA8156]
MEPSTEKGTTQGTAKRYETPLCCLQCDRQGFRLTVGEAEIQGDWARLQRWQRTVTRYVEGLLQGSAPMATHRVSVDGETYVLSNLQLFDLFTALAQAESPTKTAPLPLVGLLGGTGFALGVVVTFGLLPRSPAVEVAQTAAPPLPPLESFAEEQAPSPAVNLQLPPASENVAKSTPPAVSLP